MKVAEIIAEAIARRVATCERLGVIPEQDEVCLKPNHSFVPSEKNTDSASFDDRDAWQQRHQSAVRSVAVQDSTTQDFKAEVEVLKVQDSPRLGLSSTRACER